VEKNYVEKRLLKMFLTEDEVLMGYEDTGQNIGARSLNLLIFAVKWALYGRTQLKHESVMPLLSLSPLNIYTFLFTDQIKLVAQQKKYNKN